MRNLRAGIRYAMQKAGRPSGLSAFFTIIGLFIGLEGRAGGILAAAGIIGAYADFLGVADMILRMIYAVGHVADDFYRFAVFGVLVHLFSHLSFWSGSSIPRRERLMSGPAVFHKKGRAV